MFNNIQLSDIQHKHALPLNSRLSNLSLGNMSVFQNLNDFAIPISYRELKHAIFYNSSPPNPQDHSKYSKYDAFEDAIAYIPSSLIDTDTEIPTSAQKLVSYSSNEIFEFIIADDLPIVKEMQNSKLRIDNYRLSRQFFHSFSKEAQNMFEFFIPNQNQTMKQDILLKTLEKTLMLLIPTCLLQVFASTIRSQNSTEIDMDICVCINSGIILPHNTMDHFGHAFRAADMTDIQIPGRTRMPILRMRDPVTGYRCQIRLDSHLEINLNNLFQTYVKIDSRFYELCVIIKYWFSQRINRHNSFGAVSFSCFIIMIAFVLQKRGVLPCIKINSKDFSLIHSFQWKSLNNESIGELLIGFFKYFSSDFSYVSSVVSIVSDGLLKKETKGWTKEDQHELNKSGIKDRFWMCVEHPFDLDYNLGKHIDKETLFTIRGEFIRASKIICSGGDHDRVLNKICEK